MTERIPRRRAGVLLGIVLLGLLGLGARLSYVQGVRSEEYAEVAEAQRLRTIDLPPPRGAIYDRDGGELAVSIPARTIYANPHHVADPAATARALAEPLGVGADVLEAKLRKDKGFVYLARRVDVEVAEMIAALGLPGVDALDEARRIYPGSSLGAPLLGLVGTDAVGLAGLEYTYERLLHGEPGFRVLEQDPQGRAIPQGVFREEMPVPGSDLVLTIDRDVQFAAEQALGRAIDDTDAMGGVVLVLDPRTGEILALANQPTFDPNDPGTVDPKENRNRVVTDVFEPGSVNKVVTAAAALAEGVATPTSVYNVPAAIAVGGGRFSDAHGHATEDMTFTEVIADSSNVGTIKIGLQLGPDRLERYLREFGYGRPTTLGLPGETSGIVPSASQWGTSLPTMSIGQGVSATALQIARVYATVANDGVSLEPKLVKGWVDASGDLYPTLDARPDRVIPAGVALQMRRILAEAVADGTGTMAQVPGYAAAGKTGTAQKASGGGYAGYMASFYGFLPAEDPRVVIGVTLDEPSPYWGGVVAAPVFGEVASAAARILRVPPGAPTEVSP